MASTFRDHLYEAIDRYRELQSPEDGGWPEDRFPGAARSIVNTVETLVVFAGAGVRYEDPVVQRGLSYVAENVQLHYGPEDDETGTRGERVRYLAFALWGLSIFDEAIHDPTWEPARRFCVLRLLESRLDREENYHTGGWGEKPDDADLSVLTTSVAVQGLERICRSSELFELADPLVIRARKAIASLAVNGRASTYWSQTAYDERRPCASTTARAVLALAQGTATEQNLASQGAVWLMAHPSWMGETEEDQRPPGAHWTEMSFSLGVRAVIAAYRARRLTPADLSAVADQIDRLWSPEAREWSHGSVDTKGSPSGSSAVVLAAQALRDAWLWHPSGARRSDRRRRPVERRRFRLRIDAAWKVTVIDVNDLVRAECQLSRRRLQEMLGFLAVLQGDANDGRPIEARSALQRDLAIHFGIDADSVRRSVDRINNELRTAANRAGHQLGDLVQPAGEAPAGRRHWLNVDDAEVAREVVVELEERGVLG